MVIRRAQTAQNAKGDTYLAVDSLILRLLEDSEIGDVLKETVVIVSQVKAEIEKSRGEKGDKKVESSGDTKVQALKTYGHDLVEEVGKLGPVIGCDEETQDHALLIAAQLSSRASSA
ncbi:hypothetical protein MKW98_020539 [Papaver atlanticum]|uniref:Clp R domain-containing protein n=1 Tax=Papaver atlanticum TaxID=357466 RepID=A0AAD4SPN6_9MAGN|nr:hypothetical protein MKW98_020539 [Papaver atlanticum]